MEDLVEGGVIDRLVVKQFLEHLLPLLPYSPTLTAQRRLDLDSGFRGAYEVNPLRLWLHRLRGEYLHLIAASQLLAEWYQLVVHLGTQALIAHPGMDGVGEIERGSPLWQRFYLPLRRENKYLRREEVHFNRVQKVNRVGVGVGQHLLNGLQPLVQLVILFNAALLVPPMRGKPFLGDIVHTSAANLYLDPFTIRPHHREVERLVPVGLGMTHPVAYPVGPELVNIGDSGIDIPTLLLLVHPGRNLKDDAHREKVVHLVKLDPLGLHLVPDGVDRLHACTHLVIDAHLVERLHDGYGKILVHLVPLRCTLLDFSYKVGVRIGLLILEAKLFQLRLDSEESQTMSQGRVNVEGLPRDLKLLRGTHGRKGSHVVQAIGYLNQYHPNIVGHG